MTDSNSSDWKLSSFSIAMKNYVNNKKYDDDYGCDYKQVLMILKMMWGNLIVITMAYTSKKKLWFWRRRWWWW